MEEVGGKTHYSTPLKARLNSLVLVSKKNVTSRIWDINEFLEAKGESKDITASLQAI